MSKIFGELFGGFMGNGLRIATDGNSRALHCQPAQK